MKNIAKLLDEAQECSNRLGTNLVSLNKNIAIQMLESVGREYENSLYMPTESAINTFAPILQALGQVDLLNDHEKELVYQTVCEFLEGRGGLRESRNCPEPEEGDDFYHDKDLLIQITTDGESLDFSETAGNNYSIKIQDISSIEYKKNKEPLNHLYGILTIKNKNNSSEFRFTTMTTKTATAIAKLANVTLTNY